MHSYSKFVLLCLFAFAARPASCLSFCHLALLWSGAICLSTVLSVLSPSPLPVLCFFARVARWVSCLLAFSGAAGSPSHSGLCAPRFTGADLGEPVLPALPCCASCLCPSCLPCPARGLFCALVQLTLLCAGASFGVSGCSCDGSVALLSCWECGLA